MSIKRLFMIGLLVAVASMAGFSNASSRDWKPTREAKARDYAMIQDIRTRADGRFVWLMWFVPQMIEANAPGAETVSATLQRYVVVLTVLGRVDKTTGSMAFERVTTLEAKDQSGKPLTLVQKNNLPPATISILAGSEAMLRQSFGAMGREINMFVFDSGDVGSCKPGKLSVPLAGETYSWDTPIPGCP